mgnify:CR=1 FL=1
MKAYNLHGINDLRYEDVEIPELNPEWALVKVKASGICSSDIPRIFTKGTYHFPTIPGHEYTFRVYLRIAGTSEARYDSPLFTPRIIGLSFLATKISSG